MRLPVYFTPRSSLPQRRLFFFRFSLRGERNETVIPRRTWPTRTENGDVGSRSDFEKTRGAACSVNDLDTLQQLKNRVRKRRFVRIEDILFFYNINAEYKRRRRRRRRLLIRTKVQYTYTQRRIRSRNIFPSYIFRRLVEANGCTRDTRDTVDVSPVYAHHRIQIRCVDGES